MRELVFGAVTVMIYPTHEEAARAVARDTIAAARHAIGERGSAFINMPGGGTIVRTWELLATEYAGELPWARIHIFWGDEHILTTDDPRANFNRARAGVDLLVQRAGLPSGNVHRILLPQQGAVYDLKLARAEAARYAGVIVAAMGREPRFDWTGLGLGGGKLDDPGYAHTASILSARDGAPDYLFDSPELVECVEYPEGAPGARLRVTLTPKAFRLSGRACLFATGGDKADAIRDVLTSPPNLRRRPGSIIHEVPNATLVTDEAGARLV
jgi:6-phosphogluconolactonase